jgi:hypothetical protein
MYSKLVGTLTIQINVTVSFYKHRLTGICSLAHTVFFFAHCDNTQFEAA